MKRLLLATFAGLFLASGAFAQEMGMDAFVAKEGDSAATQGYKASMMTMMHTAPAFTGDAYVDFMKQMKVHHQAAIDMAKVLLENGKDEETKKLAQDIIAAQEKEIAFIDEWLKKKGG